MSDKIKSHHLDRKAILYVRQSSTYQVTNDIESRKLQYAMQERLRHLGWLDIDIVDDDLGRSAAGTVTRAGSERMVAEVPSLTSAHKNVCQCPLGSPIVHRRNLRSACTSIVFLNVK